jgi:hypothetical protein
LDTIKPDADKLRKQKEIKIQRIKFIVSAVFAVPLLYLSMGHMIVCSIRVLGADGVSAPLCAGAAHADSANYCGGV